jgi:hypothetical protein
MTSLLFSKSPGGRLMLISTVLAARGIGLRCPQEGFISTLAPFPDTSRSEIKATFEG